MTEKPDVTDRCTMPVIQRYVRRLLSDADRQYAEWKRKHLIDPENSHGE